MSIAFDYVDCVCSGWLAEELVDVMGKVPFCVEAEEPTLSPGLLILYEVVPMLF